MLHLLAPVQARRVPNHLHQLALRIGSGLDDVVSVHNFPSELRFHCAEFVRDDVAGPHVAVGEFFILMAHNLRVGYLRPAVLEIKVLRVVGGRSEVQVVAFDENAALVGGQVSGAHDAVLQCLRQCLFLRPVGYECAHALGHYGRHHAVEDVDVERFLAVVVAQREVAVKGKEIAHGRGRQLIVGYVAVLVAHFVPELCSQRTADQPLHHLLLRMKLKVVFQVFSAVAAIVVQPHQVARNPCRANLGILQCQPLAHRHARRVDVGDVHHLVGISFQRGQL